VNAGNLYVPVYKDRWYTKFLPVGAMFFHKAGNYLEKTIPTNPKSIRVI
jgi:hypothetical protein